MKTIQDVEVAAQSLFQVFRKIPLSAELEEIRSYLFPDGMIPVIQLEENGRKKRSSAAPANWDPQSGDIRIYLEPDSTVVRQELLSPQVPSLTEPALSLSTLNLAATQRVDDALPPISPEEVVECCQALAAAEKTNRPFISLKWFRDTYLATVDFVWARSPSGRQRVLSYAIEIGRIDGRKIPNPKSEFPTMTVALNRSIPTPGVAPRFQPIAVRGEPVSTTLLRDRGSV